MSAAYCTECQTVTEHDAHGRCNFCQFMLPGHRPRISPFDFTAGIAKLRQVVAETKEFQPSRNKHK